MEVFKSVSDMRDRARLYRRKGTKVAFVPTMGALHRGHVRLIEKAKSLADFVVVSIFLNPKQFNDPRDLQRYPRDLDKDIAVCEKAGASIVFAPSDEEMYPAGFLTSTHVSFLGNRLEGASRPGHFRGVCTVVLKLLCITQPHFLLLGLKDAQQFTILQHMVDDLCLDVEVVGVPTVRDPDGLALSSRNVLLSPADREKALCMSRALKRVHFLVKKQGILHTGELMGAIKSTIDGAGVELDYAEIVNRTTFEPLDHVVRGGTFVLLAVRVGGVRLIDNTRI